MQNIIYQGIYPRTISLNRNYFVMYKNPREKLNIFFMESYDDVAQNPHSYSTVDLILTCP